MRRLVVQQNVVGGWDVRDTEGGAAPLFRGTRAAAETWAQQLCAPTGGAVTVVSPSGAVLTEHELEAPATVPPDALTRTVAAPVPVADREPTASAPADDDSPISEHLDTVLVKGAGLALAGAAKAGVPGAATIRSEGRYINAALSLVLGLGLLSSSLVSASMSSLGNSWIGVLLATLTWSGGVVGTTYLARKGELSGPPLLVAAAILFVVAGVVASYVGVGVLDVDPLDYSGPQELVVAYVNAAITTYGGFGALISGAIAVWLGWRLAEGTEG